MALHASGEDSLEVSSPPAAPRLGEARPRARVWIGLAFVAAIAAAAGVLARSGAEKSGVEAALRLTARLAFAFFWPAYAGRALAVLFGPVFLPLKRRARALGLAFAAVFVVHLSLVGWLCWIGAAPSRHTFVVFGAGVIWIGLLALFSIKRLSPMIGDRGWWVLRNVGITWILVDFGLDFLRPSGGDASVAHVMAYAPFAALVVLGPVLRALAWLKPMLIGKGEARA